MSTTKMVSQDVTFTSVNPITDLINITNIGSSNVDITNYWLFSEVGGNNVRIGTIVPISGDYMLSQNESVTLSYDVNEANGSLTLFSTNDFFSTDQTILLSFLQWGAPAQSGSSGAVDAGRWISSFNFVSGKPAYTTTAGGSAAAWTACGANGGEIQIAGTTDTAKSICVGEGIEDLIAVEFTSASTTNGTNDIYVITDQSTGEILGTPLTGPFNLEDANAGVCDIWYLRYENGLTGLVVGQNVSGLSGCFDLSNAISITRLIGADCNTLIVSDFETDFDFFVNPNPTKDSITLNYNGNESLDFDVQIFDLLGNQVLRTTMSSTTRNMALSMSNLSLGIYLLNISDKASGIRITKRVIKN